VIDTRFYGIGSDRLCFRKGWSGPFLDRRFFLLFINPSEREWNDSISPSIKLRSSNSSLFSQETNKRVPAPDRTEDRSPMAAATEDRARDQDPILLANQTEDRATHLPMKKSLTGNNNFVGRFSFFYRRPAEKEVCREGHPLNEPPIILMLTVFVIATPGHSHRAARRQMNSVPGLSDFASFATGYQLSHWRFALQSLRNTNERRFHGHRCVTVLHAHHKELSGRSFVDSKG